MEANSAVLIAGPAAELLSSLLRGCDIACRTVAGGVEALTDSRSHHPAVIILSSDLPDMDSASVLKRLRRDERTRDIPVLFFCAEPEQQKEALRLGATDVLSPFLSPDETIARVRTHFELGTLRAGARQRAAAESPVASSSGLMTLAMQAGRMYAFEWDARTDEVYRSRSSVQVLAGDASRDTGQNWFRRIHPDDVDHLRRVLALLSPAYDAYDTKYRVQRSDGGWITIRESSRGFFDSANHLVRVTGVVFDVTDQAAAERDLAGMQAEIMKLLD